MLITCILLTIIFTIIYTTPKLIITLAKRSNMNVGLQLQPLDPNVLFAIWKWMIDRILVATGRDWVSYVRGECVNADLVTAPTLCCIRMGTPLHEVAVGRILDSGQAQVLSLDVHTLNIPIINTSKQEASDVATSIIQQYPETYPILCRIIEQTIPNGTIERIEQIVPAQHYMAWIMVRSQVYPNGVMDVFIDLISGPPNLTPIHITAILIKHKKIGYSQKDQEYKYLLDNTTETETETDTDTDTDTD